MRLNDWHCPEKYRKIKYRLSVSVICGLPVLSYLRNHYLVTVVCYNCYRELYRIRGAGTPVAGVSGSTISCFGNEGVSDMKYPDLRRLTVCRNLLEDAVIRKLLCVQEQLPAETEEGGQALFSAQGELTDLLVQKAEHLGISGNVLSAYMVHCLAEGGNTAAKTIEAAGRYGSGLK